MLAPVVIFTYKRIDVLKRTLNALALNKLAENTEVYFFSDGPKRDCDAESVFAVRQFLRTISGFRAVHLIERNYNYGLAANVVDGVTSVLKLFPYVIVLEDDLVTSRYFLNFMNDALQTYEKDESVCQVCGYSYLEKLSDQYKLDDIYFIKGADCLAWATWRRAWQNYQKNTVQMLEEIRHRGLVRAFNRNNCYNYYKMLRRAATGEINSWAINWYAGNFLKNRYTLYPLKSLALHIGNDSAATNYQIATPYDPLEVMLCNNPIIVKRINVFEKTETSKAYNLFLARSRGSLFRQAQISIKRKFKKFCEIVFT